MRTCRYLLILTISHLFAQICSGIHFIDLPNPDDQEPPIEAKRRSRPIRRHLSKNTTPPPDVQKGEGSQDWLQFRSKGKDGGGFDDDEKDSNIKNKIATLVQQTVLDSERKVQSIASLQDKHREEPPYRIGFVLSMIKKARDVLNELFNVAVKHRDEWKALEQLKIFELIVHTNVDTTNLVRQMVEIHIQYLNATQSGDMSRKRVVLLK